MHDSLRPHHIPECFDDTLEAEDLAWVRISDGVIALSAMGREYALAQGAEALKRRAEHYRQVALGNIALADQGVREYIDKGREGSVYQLSSLSTIAVKEITNPHGDDDPLAQLTHMESLRLQIDALGLDWIGVPEHYGMFFPDDNSAPHLAMENVEGVRVWNVFRLETEGEFFKPIPPEYTEEMGAIANHYQLLEPTLHRHFGADAIDDMLRDWGSHNVIVQKTPEASRPYKFWIIDQASTPPPM